MCSISIVVAYDKNRGIGKDNKIPWKLPSEMAHFRKTTSGHSVIMGRKTWDSLPEKYKPLPDRTNIIVSRNWIKLMADSASYGKTSLMEGPYFAGSIPQAIGQAKMLRSNKDIFIIGGAAIYAEALNYADTVIASEIKDEYFVDTFFPKLNDNFSVFSTTKHDLYDVVTYSKLPPVALKEEIPLSIVCANEIKDSSWLNEKRFAWFKQGYQYASTQTRAIPILSKLTPEEFYFAVCAINTGATRTSFSKEWDSNEGFSPKNQE